MRSSAILAALLAAPALALAFPLSLRASNDDLVARKLPPKPQTLEEKPKPYDPHRGYRSKRAYDDSDLFARTYDDEDLFAREYADDALFARAIPERPPPLATKPKPHSSRRRPYYRRWELEGEDGLFERMYDAELD